MQAVATGFLTPVLRQGKTDMSGEGSESCGTLLATAASILVTAQGLKQHVSVEGALTAEIAQPSEIRQVGPTPGGAAAGGAAAAGVLEEGLFKGADRRLCSSAD